jgi:hypothetical protein
LSFKEHINKHQFTIVTIIFVVLYAWQPFFAGIYSDDWGFLLSYFTENPNPSAPFSIDRLEHFMKVYTNRPLSGVMYYIVNSICGYDVVLVNLLMIVGVFITLYCFYLFAKELFEFLEYKSPNLLGSLASLIWLVSPWTLGATVWYSSSINLLAIIFFSLSMRYFFKGLADNKGYYIRVSIYYLLSCLTYESFFFQYFIFILIAWLYRNRKNISTQLLKRHSINLTIIIALAIAWNRLTSVLFISSIHKEFNPYFWQTILVNIVSFPYIVIKSFGALDFLMLAITLVSIIYIVRAYAKSHIAPSELLKSKQVRTVLLLLSGIFAGLLLYSAAGYTFWGLGSRSRTMFVASFYVPLILIVLTNLIYRLESLNIKFAKSMILLALTVSFASMFLCKLDWLRAESLQKKIIQSIPTDKFAMLDSNSTVIVVAPFRSDWISVIDAPWAVNTQMKYGQSFYAGTSLHQASKANFVVGRGLVHPVSNQHYQNYWDGKYLYQGYKLKENAADLDKNFYFTRLDKFRADQLYVWNYYDGTFKQIYQPQLLEYKPFYNYDYWVTWIYNNWVTN